MNYTNELLYSVSIVKYEKRLIHPMFIIPIKILYAYFIFLSFIKNQENTISKIKVINIILSYFDLKHVTKEEVIIRIT